MNNSYETVARANASTSELVFVRAASAFPSIGFYTAAQTYVKFTLDTHPTSRNTETENLTPLAVETTINAAVLCTQYFKASKPTYAYVYIDYRESSHTKKGVFANTCDAP